MSTFTSNKSGYNLLRWGPQICLCSDQWHPKIEVMKTYENQVLYMKKARKNNKPVALDQKPSPAWHLKLV